MLKFLMIAALLSGTNSYPDTRIIGGKEAPDGKVPYQAFLQFLSPSPWLKCGATIISSQWIMTAAHCINPKDPLKTYKVRVGTNDRNNGGKALDIKRVVVHPQNQGLLNDIALIQTSKIDFTDRIRPIAIPNKDTAGGANIMITGWGGIGNNRSPDRLQMVNVTALSYDECLKKNDRTQRSQLCTEGGKGKGVCPGDSGGPLVEGNAVVGIVSFYINNCGDGLPDGATRVFYFRDWILKTIS